MAEYVGEPGEGTALRDKEDIEVPRRFKVLLHNDHYTTMDFVVMVLAEVFRKSQAEAEKIMLNVHQNGIGVAGVFVKAIAESKVAAVHKLAEGYGFPLRCSIEPE